MRAAGGTLPHHVTTTEITRASVGLRSERGPVLLAVMLSVGLVAIDATILATAVPSVVGDLGGFTEFPWLFSVYLLAQAVSVPLYGKLSDVVGRKPVMLVGIGLFVLGSLLCGLAWSMGALIAFRVVQGLGAGAVQPVSMTIIGDIYSMAERAKVQGYVASVWALSSVIGPTLGGVFSDYLSWRWIFFVNLPLGAAAAWMLARRFHEDVERRKHSIDYAGATLLAVGGTLLLLGLLEGGQRWAWDSATSLVLFAVSAALLALFVVVERRAAEPMLPLWVLGDRTLNAANLASMVVGVLTLGLSSYVPLYAQGVLGHGAVVAGLALAAMTLGWPVAASNAGRFYLGIGFRWTLLMGAVFAVVGGLVLLTVGAGSTVGHLAGACFVIGIGFGFVASPAVVAAQSTVTWRSRGVVTGANMFARSVGSAVGVAIFGAVANAEVTRRIGHTASGLDHVPGSVLAPSLHTVFVVSAAITAALVLIALLMPDRVTEPEPAAD
jgi:EmrB/QacA subfamily drug resistance transporter